MQENQDSKNLWRKCSVCKKDIALGSKYYICSVSSCNGLRTGFQFCTVHCFDAHVPSARHREAGAIEKKAPLQAPLQDVAEASFPVPQRTLVRPGGLTSSMSSQTPKEVLVIASRLKEYISSKGGYNTSGSVMDVLSNHLRTICERAIDNARAEGRKTVMDRDFEFLFKG